MVTYEELLQLIAFSNTHTLAEVAEQFHVSQPSITRNMKKIETEFGVPLFQRTKNSISLTETGNLAVLEATMVVKQMEDMIHRVRSYDRAQHTISLGSCAAVPVPELNRQITAFFSDSTLSTDVKSLEDLVSGLEDDTYQLIILPFESGYPNLKEKAIGEEHLMFCLPENHRFAGRESLTLAEMDGENMLLYQNIGFWHDIVAEKMPHSRFLVQSERYSFTELIRNSTLPCFATDLSIRAYGTNGGGVVPGRINIPITDPEVNITYYLVCKKENEKKFAALFQSM